MAQEISYDNAGLQTRIQKGNDLVTELNTTRTKLQSVDAALAPDLVGQWGTAHRNASAELDVALSKVATLMNDRNTYIQTYWSQTSTTDTDNQGQTSAAGAAMGPIASSLQ